MHDVFEWIMWPQSQPDVGTLEEVAVIRQSIFINIGTRCEKVSMPATNPIIISHIKCLDCALNNFLQTQLNFVFEKNGKEILYNVRFCLKQFQHLMSGDNVLPLKFEAPWCILFDFVNAHGCTEAVAESAYSELSHHVQAGQRNETAECRLFIDHNTPTNVLSMTGLVNASASRLIVSKGIQPLVFGYPGSRKWRGVAASKVMSRLAGESSNYCE